MLDVWMPLITPDEHGASNRIRSKNIESHQDWMSLASSTIICKYPRRRFSLMSSALSGSISIAVTDDDCQYFLLIEQFFLLELHKHQILPDWFSTKNQLQVEPSIMY